MPAIAIVPAAGKAERFGGAKLVADLKGEPLIDHTILSLLDGGIARIVGPAAIEPPSADAATRIRARAEALGINLAGIALSPDRAAAL